MRRQQVFERDGYRCVYCGEVFTADALTVDHVQPRMKGGDSSGGNLVTACRGCNTAKGGMRLSHYLLATPAARAHFALHAVHVWPRILRTLEEEMRREAGEFHHPTGGVSRGERREKECPHEMETPGGLGDTCLPEREED